MRWEDERYVRLYTRDTVTWKMLPWQAKCVLPLLLRKLDRAGVMTVGDDGDEGVAAALEIPHDVVAVGLAALIKRGVLTLVAGTLVMPNFLDAQEATSSGAQRQREHRARARDLARAGLREDERKPAVYFVQAENGGPIKIGFAQDVAARLVSLQTSHPEKLVLLATIPGDEALERDMHARFASIRSRGEWFEAAPILMQFIRSLALPETKRDVSRDETSHVTPSLAVPSRAEPSRAVPDQREKQPPLAEQLCAAWEKTKGHTYELSWKDGQRLRGLLKHGDAEVLRRWGIALRWRGFPTCNSVSDLEQHWNAYGKEQEAQTKKPDPRRDPIRAEDMNHSGPTGVLDDF